MELAVNATCVNDCVSLEPLYAHVLNYASQYMTLGDFRFS